MFAELKNTIAMSAMDIVMPPLMVWSDMLAVVSMCIVEEGVEVAIAVVGEAIFIPDISIVQASEGWMKRSIKERSVRSSGLDGPAGIPSHRSNNSPARDLEMIQDSRPSRRRNVAVERLKLARRTGDLDPFSSNFAHFVRAKDY